MQNLSKKKTNQGPSRPGGSASDRVSQNTVLTQYGNNLLWMFLQGAGLPFPLPVSTTGWATLFLHCRTVQKESRFRLCRCRCCCRWTAPLELSTKSLSNRNPLTQNELCLFGKAHLNSYKQPTNNLRQGIKLPAISE